MIGLAAGFLLPALAALLVARRVAPAGERLTIAAPLVALAYGLASAIAFALLVADVRSRIVFLAVDASIWVGVAVLACLRVGASSLSPRAGTARTADRLLGAAFVVLFAATLAIALVWFVSASSVYPHGEWDAWAQWNLRARFFFRGFGDGAWRDAFADVLQWSHPDYPMLVPMSVARLWLYGGTETVLVPVLFGGLIAACVVATAALAVGRTHGAAYGCLAAAVLLAGPSFVRYSAAQCADVALGLFLLSAFVLWARAEASGTAAYWILAGAAAALAGWTKNEGLAACAIVVTAVACAQWWTTRGVRAALLVLVGAAPILAVILTFKSTLAPPSYFTSEQTLAQAIDNLTDVGRLRLVGLAFANEMRLTGATVAGVLPFLFVFAVIRGVDRQAPAAARAAVPAMLLLLGVYAAAYLVSPKDLVWQLRTSLDRLVLQVVPTLTWAVIALCRRAT